VTYGKRPLARASHQVPDPQQKVEDDSAKRLVFDQTRRCWVVETAAETRQRLRFGVLVW
jgi:hypothetical protein